MLLLVPLIGLSFVPSTVISTFADPVMEFLGLQGGFWTYALFGLTAVVSIALNALVVWLILGHLGGVTPGRRPRLVGALIGAVGIEVLKYLLSFIIAWSVGKPSTVRSPHPSRCCSCCISRSWCSTSRRA